MENHMTRSLRSALFVLVCIVILALLALGLYHEPESPNGIEVTFNPGVSYEEAFSLMAARNLTIAASWNTTVMIGNQRETVPVMEARVPEGLESEIKDYVEELKKLRQVYDVRPVIVYCC